MALLEALNKAVQEFGKSVLTEQRLINILNDYHGFDEMPAARPILKAMQSDGCISQIIGDEELSKTRISHISKRLNQLFGFDVALVEQIIENLSSAKRSNLINRSTKVTQEDLAYGIKDEYGAIYSHDGDRLLNAPNISVYTIKPGIQVICDNAFKGHNALESINIPKSVTHIGDGAFTFCKALTSIVIPDSVIHIGIGALDDCCGLTDIQVNKNNRVYDSRENCNAIIHTSSNTVVAGCSKTIIPNSVTHIGGGAFFGCSALTNIVIPDSVTHIGYDAFFGCKALTSIVIPNSVIDIGNSAFSSCSALSSIVIRNSVTHIAPSAFVSCDNLTSIIIPKGSRNKFQELLISDNYKLIEQGDDEQTPSSKVTNKDIANGVKDEFGALYSPDGKRLLRGINISSYCIKPGTQVICDRAFDNCYSLTNITIPDTVTHIGTGAFRDCLRLSNVSLPESIMFLGKCAFTNCMSLRSIRLPKQISQIREETFSRCRSLRKVIIEEGMKRIGENAFTWCASLKSVELPSTMINVSKGAFDWTPISLKIKIPEDSRNRYEHLMPQYKDRFVSNKQSWVSKLFI